MLAVSTFNNAPHPVDALEALILSKPTEVPCQLTCTFAGHDRWDVLRRGVGCLIWLRPRWEGVTLADAARITRPPPFHQCALQEANHLNFHTQYFVNLISCTMGATCRDIHAYSRYSTPHCQTGNVHACRSVSQILVASVLE